MGGCLSDIPQNNNRIQRQNTITYNPIKKIINGYSISYLNQKWSKQQMKQFQSKTKLSSDKSIDFNTFLSIFPKLNKLSRKIQYKYFELLAYQGKTQISSKQLMISLTIIRKVQYNKDFAPLLFFVYTQDQKHQLMNQDELKLFQQQNKDHLKHLVIDNQDQQDLIQHDQMRLEALQTSINGNTDKKINFKSQISATDPQKFIKNRKKQILKTDQFLLTPVSSQRKILNQSPNNNYNNKNAQTPRADKKYIQLNKFVPIFENYNLKSYQLLFSWNIEQEQKDLAVQIEQNGLQNKSGDKVYLIQFQWFVEWKQYIQHKYNIQLQENIKSDYNTHIRKKISESGLKSSKTKYLRPGIINNSILIQNKKGCFLIKNLVENTHYICVKQYIWNQLIAIYNGGPFIQRIYPTIYYNTVVKVRLDQNGRFKPNQIKKYQNTKQKWRISQYAQSYESHYACFYKYFGKSSWIYIDNVQKKGQQLFTSSRTYIVFVPPNIIKKFKNLYNLFKINQEQSIQQRIKNYGSRINVYIQGVLTTAQVIQILTEDMIMIEYITENGNTSMKKIKIDEKLKNINPKNISQDNKLNQLAGIINICNSCYLNAVVQCIIRTPYFGGYLESQFFQDNEKQNFLLLKQISQIYKKSKEPTIQSINPLRLKKVFEKIYPYFEGDNQHDAQEFLNNLLSRVLEEINSKKQQYGMTASVKLKAKKDNNNNKNQKINRFFSGQTKAETYCLKCNNRGEKIEPFFTYSISLPQIKQMQFYYYYFRYHKKSKTMVPERYGLTLSRKVRVDQFFQAASKQLKIPHQNLFFCTLFNNQILHRLDQTHNYRQVLYYLHFNAKLAIYEVNHSQCPTFQQFRSKFLKNSSIKLQLRHRIYSSKTKQYKLIFMPILLQVDESYYWKDVLSDIDSTIQKMDKKSLISGNTQQNKYRSDKKIQYTIQQNSSHRISADHRQKNEQFNNINHSQVKSPSIKSFQSIKTKYKIRVIKSDHYYQNYCLFCKQQLNPIKSIKRLKLCDGKCGFSPAQELIDQKQFRNVYDNIIITVDWQQISPQIQQPINHPSYHTTKQKSDNRKDDLQKLIAKNIQNQQILELTCQKKQCLHPTARRTQKIEVYPNILLLHLKRFTFQDNMMVKLTNNVIYPEILVLNNNGNEQKYELYGVICHYGSGVGGHYIAFVHVNSKWYRCDDHNVTIATNNQHIDSNAYLLFYKKIDFEPSLKALSIR